MKPAPAPSPDELAASLQTLRLLVREVGANYLASLQADIALVQRALGHASPDRQRRTDRRRMQKWIAELDVKPAKGRRRDLKQLDKLIARLTATVENW